MCYFSVSFNRYLFTLQMTRDGDKHTLVISRVTAQTTGVYSCRATNTKGAADCSAELFIADSLSKADTTDGNEIVNNKKYSSAVFIHGLLETK